MINTGDKVAVLDPSGRILWRGTVKYVLAERWAGVAYERHDPRTATLGNGRLDEIPVERLRRV